MISFVYGETNDKIFVVGTEPAGEYPALDIVYTGAAYNWYDLFYSSNLLNNSWLVKHSQVFKVEETNKVFFTDVGFYRFGDALKDSDGDGVSDMREKLIYHTDPFKFDTDDDGENDYTEIEDGITNNNGAVSYNDMVSFIVDCEGYAENFVVYESKTVAVPLGCEMIGIDVFIFSREYPAYTGSQSQFNDIVGYEIDRGWYSERGVYHVNDLHKYFSPDPSYGGMALVSQLMIPSIENGIGATKYAGWGFESHIVEHGEGYEVVLYYYNYLFFDEVVRIGGLK